MDFMEVRRQGKRRQSGVCHKRFRKSHQYRVPYTKNTRQKFISHKDTNLCLLTLSLTLCSGAAILVIPAGILKTNVEGKSECLAVETKSHGPCIQGCSRVYKYTQKPHGPCIQGRSHACTKECEVERCALSTSASNFFPLSEHGKVESFGS